MEKQPPPFEKMPLAEIVNAFYAQGIDHSVITVKDVMDNEAVSDYEKALCQTIIERLEKLK